MIYFFGLFWIGQVFAASGVSNGADQTDFLRGSAWFLEKTADSQKVSYCVEVNSQFGVSKQYAETVIEKALFKWSKYLKERMNYQHWAPQIARNFEKLKACSGSEDLTFFLGIETPELETERLRYTNPSALAVRTAYDSRRGWGRGFIWVDNSGSNGLNWKNEGALFAVLLHEIGHVFGNGHIRETIMREDIVGHVKTQLDNNVLEKESSIDQDFQLLLQEKEVSYSTAASGVDVLPIKQEHAFQALFSRKRVGKISAEINRKDLILNEFDLTIRDQKSTKSFRIQIDRFLTASHNGPYAFRRFLAAENKQPIFMSGYTTSKGYTYVGRLKSVLNETIPVVITENSMPLGGVTIYVINKIGTHFLVHGNK